MSRSKDTIKSKISESLWAKIGIYAGVLAAIAELSIWMHIEVPAGHGDSLIILILLGALIIWIDHNFQKRKH